MCGGLKWRRDDAETMYTSSLQYDLWGRFYKDLFFSDAGRWVLCGRGTPRSCGSSTKNPVYLWINVYVSVKYALLPKINVSRGTLSSEIDKQNVDVVGTYTGNARCLADGCRLVLCEFAACFGGYGLQL